MRTFTTTLKELTPLDIRLLKIIEHHQRLIDFTPLETIIEYMKKSPYTVEDLLRKLHKRKLIEYRSFPEPAYRLTFFGYDMLAWRFLVDNDYVVAIGRKLGVGKESEVFLGQSADGNTVCIKVHRLGVRNFRYTKRQRQYIAEKPDLQPIFESRISAKREYQALSRLHHTINVPKPLIQNRHIVVMEFIDGIDLYKVKKLEFNDAKIILEEIIDAITTAVIKHGIIHGDLSEFNVMLTYKDALPYIIDWPQWIDLSSPNADEYLARDFHHIVRYFVKKYQIRPQLSIEELVESTLSADRSQKSEKMTQLTEEE